MYINNKWYTESEVSAYVQELESKVADLEERHWNECRQIAQYNEELTKVKSLMALAVNALYADDFCNVCARKFNEPHAECFDSIGLCNFVWRYQQECDEVLYGTKDKT